MQFGAAAGFPSSVSATWTFNSSTSSFCSKSQIRIAGPQAAQSQYRFGLKTRVLISLAPSKQWSGLCALSPKSQSIALPSCPPLAARDPSGETMTGFWVVGENCTELTHSLWPFLPSWLHLSSPRVFQSLMVLSRPAEMICRLSAEKATERTSCLWPVNRVVVMPRSRSQSRRVLSHEAETANWPQELTTTSETKWLWPFNRFIG